MKTKTKLIVTNTIFAVILLFGIALLVYTLLYQKKEPIELIKPLGVILISAVKLISNIIAIKKGDFEAATEEFNKYCDTYFAASRKTLRLVKQGYKLYSTGENHQALRVFSKGLQAADKEDNYKGKGVLYYFMGACYYDLMNYKMAIESYNSALHDNPYLDGAWSNLGLIYMDQGDLERARQCFEKAVSMNQNSAEAYNNLGALYLRQEKVEVAINTYKKALDIQPNYNITLGNIALAYAINGDFTNADKHYKLAVAHGYTGAKKLKMAIENVKM